jgi:hypothetical protein
MQKKSNLTLLCLLMVSCLVIFLLACRKENAKTYTYTLIKPIYKDKSEVLAAINGNATQSIKQAGKIYIKDKFIFLNEVDKGIHIIDNSNPSRPVQIAFLDIPGNQDIAVKGNILYADMYGDLLAIDISNPKKVTITSLLPGLFKDRISYMYINNVYTQSNQVLVGWITKDTTVNAYNMNYVYADCNGCLYNSNAVAPAAGNTKTGVTGSMSRMVMINDYLYVLAGLDSLGIVNTTNDAVPSLVSYWYAGFELQTIYPFENRLFLGSARGMFMYDVSNPVNPVTLGQFSHGHACDPVVTDGRYAYVTLHAGTQCGGTENELNVINVKNLLAPQLVKSYPMTKPAGLCKDGNLLFVCDGSSGVKLYDASNAADLKLLQRIKSNDPYDVIADNHHAMVVTKDGLYQYDYSDIHNIRLLSFFSTKVKISR